jgi:tripartite-type tricarboxylate transporter receptor subunit TctC
MTRDATRRTVLATLIAALAVLVLPPSALAQDWPTRPVRVIIPLGPGGGGDVFTRTLNDELQKRFGQPFIMENRPGGALNIGTRACAEAAPDGYTICVLTSEPMVYNPFLFKSLPFDPDKDFEPVTNLFFNTVAFVANSSLKVRTVPELVALAKSKPGTLSYSTFSFPLAHFMEKLKKQNDIDVVRVSFRSGNEVVNAILSGASPIAFLGLANMIPQIQSGAITALAVNANTRSPLFPEVPTITEATGEELPPSWFGMFAPAGFPKPIIARLSAEIGRITGDPDFRRRAYYERAVEPAANTPEEFARFIREDRRIAGRIWKESGQQPR